MVNVVLSHWSLYVYLAALFVIAIGLFTLQRRSRRLELPVLLPRGFADPARDRAGCVAAASGSSDGAKLSAHTTARRPAPVCSRQSARRPEDIARDLAGLLR